MEDEWHPTSRVYRSYATSTFAPVSTPSEAKTPLLQVVRLDHLDKSSGVYLSCAPDWIRKVGLYSLILMRPLTSWLSFRHSPYSQYWVSSHLALHRVDVLRGVHGLSVIARISGAYYISQIGIDMHWLGPSSDIASR